MIDPAERQQWADIYAQEAYVAAGRPRSLAHMWAIIKWAESMAAIAEQHAPNDDDATMEVEA